LRPSKSLPLDFGAEKMSSADGANIKHDPTGVKTGLLSSAVSLVG
jgi:hypothetical protein